MTKYLLKLGQTDPKRPRWKIPICVEIQRKVVICEMTPAAEYAHTWTPLAGDVWTQRDDGELPRVCTGDSDSLGSVSLSACWFFHTGLISVESEGLRITGYKHHQSVTVSELRLSWHRFRQWINQRKRYCQITDMGSKINVSWLTPTDSPESD